MAFAASRTPCAAPATPGLVMVCATKTILLPETAVGPVVGPSQVVWIFWARRTAARALARTVGQPPWRPWGTGTGAGRGAALAAGEGCGRYREDDGAYQSGLAVRVHGHSSRRDDSVVTAGGHDVTCGR